MPYSQDRKEIYDQAAQHAVYPVFKRAIPATKQSADDHPHAQTAKATAKGNVDMSFIMLTDSQVVPFPSATPFVEESKEGKLKVSDISEDAPAHRGGNLSQQAEAANRLFEILSSRSDIDHPICSECTDLLLSSLQSRLAASTRERDVYISFLKSLHNSDPTPAEVSKAQASLDTAKKAQSKAFEELLALEREKASLEDDVANLEAEALVLDDEEHDFWRSRNAFALTWATSQNDRDALNAAFDHDSQQLERLQRTNVYNDTFSIGHDGYFGTINDLRLGRLPPPHNVDWSEINAAWGSAALLLTTVAERLGFDFQGYRIKPRGSTSTIEKLEYPSPQQSIMSNALSNSASSRQTQMPKVTSLDLFSSGDLPLGRMILHRRLDAGMVAFLECLRQIGKFAEMTWMDSLPSTQGPALTSPRSGGSGDSRRSEAAIKLPYDIRKDKIGDTSIRLSVSDDEAWTRACKYVLTCCKYLLAHASNMDGSERRGGRG